MPSIRPIVFITGANTGIGLEAVKAFLQSPTTTAGYHILLGSRSLEKGQAAIASLQAEFPASPTTLELVQIDVTSDASIQAAFESISANHPHIDALVNNAGAVFDHWLDTPADEEKLSLRDTLLRTFDVNVAGAHVVTHTFVPLLLKSPPSSRRLLFVTSGLSSLKSAAEHFLPPPHDVAPPLGWPKEGFQLTLGYRSSKAGLNMLMLGWRHALQGDGVKTWCLSPGFLATGLGGNVERLKRMGGGDPALGGGFIKDVVDGGRDGDSGKVITRFGVQDW